MIIANEKKIEHNWKPDLFRNFLVFRFCYIARLMTYAQKKSRLRTFDEQKPQQFCRN